MPTISPPETPVNLVDYQVDEVVPETARMRHTLKAQIKMKDVVVEVRTYEWDEPEALIYDLPVYHVSRLLTRMRHKQRIRWRLPDEPYPRTVAQISIIPPHSPIMVESSGGQATFVSCIFEPDYFERMLGVTEWTNELTATFLGVHNPFVEAVMERLAQEVVFPQADSDTLLQALLTSLTFELARIVKLGDPALRRPGKLAHWQLERVRTLVEGPVDGRAVTMAELAGRCSISPRHLMRGFKAATGTTIHAYIAQVRLERAKALLDSATIPLKEISAEVGFANPSHFAAEFRRRIGCSPSEYRARIRMA
jgi:AraC family transcriptional regulator